MNGNQYVLFVNEYSTLIWFLSNKVRRHYCYIWFFYAKVFNHYFYLSDILK